MSDTVTFPLALLIVFGVIAFTAYVILDTGLAVFGVGVATGVMGVGLSLWLAQVIYNATSEE